MGGTKLESAQVEKVEGGRLGGNGSAEPFIF